MSTTYQPQQQGPTWKDVLRVIEMLEEAFFVYAEYSILRVKTLDKQSFELCGQIRIYERLEGEHGKMLHFRGERWPSAGYKTMPGLIVDLALKVRHDLEDLEKRGILPAVV